MTCSQCEGYLALRELHLTFLEYFCVACGRETTVEVPEGEIVKRKKEARERQIQRVSKEFEFTNTTARRDMPQIDLTIPSSTSDPTAAQVILSDASFTKDFKTEVAEYTIHAKNYYWSAKKFQIPRDTIHNWVKEYRQHGGEGWLSKNHT
tara:strand:- start:1986 stop:2435 length:450 start_codon:yes stop_codon:yes gene_type:complete